jgi:hypothetical protein
MVFHYYILNPTLGRVERRLLRPNPTCTVTQSLQFLTIPSIPFPLSTPTQFQIRTTLNVIKKHEHLKLENHEALT